MLQFPTASIIEDVAKQMKKVGNFEGFLQPGNVGIAAEKAAAHLRPTSDSFTSQYVLSVLTHHFNEAFLEEAYIHCASNRRSHVWLDPPEPF
jgi:hypothetical protein